MFGLIAFIILIFFYSCSTEDESINKSGKTESITKSEKNKSIVSTEAGLNISMQENLNLFSEQIFVSVESLEIALNKNTDVDFNDQAMQMLETAGDEYDLKIVFEMAGIANSQEVINILKGIVAKQQAFITQNSSFYSLTPEKQAELLNASIEFAKITYNSNVLFPPFEVVGANPCARSFNNSRGDCIEDFAVCSAGAIYAAAGGLWPGLAVAAGCMAMKLLCDHRVKRDYKECLQSKEDVPPTTGELTVHCDKYADSCWTTDSNGKYVGRYYGPSK
nr:hypothetical protein [uncultured Flavobacterium sp.]